MKPGLLLCGCCGRPLMRCYTGRDVHDDQDLCTAWGSISTCGSFADHLMGDAELPRPKLRVSLPNLVLRIHDERTLRNHELVNRIGMSE